MSWFPEPSRFQTRHSHYLHCPRELTGTTKRRRVEQTKEGLMQTRLSARDRLPDLHNWQRGRSGERLDRIHSH